MSGATPSWAATDTPTIPRNQRCSQKSACQSRSTKGMKSKMLSTAMNDNWKPTSNSADGSNNKITMAAKANRLSDARPRPPTEKTA